jgi:hypothetical protein
MANMVTDKVIYFLWLQMYLQNCIELGIVNKFVVLLLHSITGVQVSDTSKAK